MVTKLNLQEAQELKNKLNRVPNWSVVSVDTTNGRHEFLISDGVEGKFLRVFAERKRDKNGVYFKLEYSDLFGNVSANSTTKRGN